MTKRIVSRWLCELTNIIRIMTWLLLLESFRKVAALVRFSKITSIMRFQSSIQLHVKIKWDLITYYQRKLLNKWYYISFAGIGRINKIHNTRWNRKCSRVDIILHQMRKLEDRRWIYLYLYGYFFIQINLPIICLSSPWNDLWRSHPLHRALNGLSWSHCAHIIRKKVTCSFHCNLNSADLYRVLIGIWGIWYFVSFPVLSFSYWPSKYCIVRGQWLV